MSTYAQLLIPPEHFKAAASKAETDAAGDPRSNVRTVRRPTRGITLKEDTFATMRLVAGSGSNRKLIDAGGRRTDSNGQFMEVNGKRATDVYSNFLLQAINEERAEKFQILETFGEAYIFLFGQRARMMTFQGILVNTWDFNWEAEWWENYELYLRGTKCVEQDAMVFLSFDNTIVGGYILQANATKDATQRNFVNFQFQMFVTTYSNYSNIGDPYAMPPNERMSQGAGPSPMELRNVTEADLAQYRPTLIDPTTVPDSLYYDDTGQLQEGTLAERLKEISPSEVVKSWQSIGDITRNALQTVTGILSGSVMRVPVGFAGNLAYDDADMVRIVQAAEVGGVVRYTTFDDNDDEYVGSSDHYGSSALDLGKQNYGDYYAKYGQDDEPLTKKAERIWSDAGYDVNSSWAQTLANAVSLVKLGLTVVPAAVSITKSLTTGTTGKVDLTAGAIPRQTLPAPPR